MRLLDVKGNLRNKAVSKYIIDWDEPSRSKLQFRAKKFFEPYWSAHIVYEEFPVYGSRMRAELNDFLFIEIEYDEVDSLTTEWFEEKYDLIL